MLKKIACALLLLCITAGIFPLTASAEENKKIVRVGYYDDSQGFQSGSGDGERKSGYAYEYYQEIAKYTGWIYEYEYGSWEEIYEKLLSGEVDIMAGISKTVSHSREVLFPDTPMGEESYCIFTQEETAGILGQDPGNLEGARIGVKENAYMSELLKTFLAENDVSCEMIAYSGLEERLEDLEDGKLDCIVTVDSEVIQGLVPIYEIGSSDFYFAVNREREDILEELNMAQEEILSSLPYYVSRLQDKYFNESTVQAKLTEREREWLAEHPVLQVGYLTDYMPFCDRKEDGGLDGMLQVILAELSEYMGVQFEVTSYDNYSEMIQALEEGGIQMVFPTFGDLWYSENQNYNQTLSVASARMCVVYRGSYRSDIYGRIAVSEGSPLQPFYLTINYPEAEQVFYRDWEQCLDAIQAGDADCMLINSDLIYRYLNENSKYSGLNVAELEDTVNFCFAVKRGENTLYSLLNKGLNTIDEMVINDAIIRNSYVEPTYTIRDFLVNHLGLVMALAGGFILLLIVFFVLYRRRVLQERRVQQEAYEREKEYMADKEKRFNIIASLSRIYVCTYYINLKEMSYQKIANLGFRGSNRKLAGDVRDFFVQQIETDVEEQYREKLKDFLQLDTLVERMKGTDSLSMEYETKSLGWCRGSFISSERGEDGRLLYVIYAIQEVNAEKKAQYQAQRALQEAYEAANRANQAKSNFLSRMSHDIRTPMNAIIGMTTIAATHIEDKERVSDCLKKITVSGQHLLTLINEVLDMSKIESGKFQLQKEEFELQELVDNLLTIVRPQVEAKGQDLRVSIQDVKHERVIGDIMHLQQAFVNILGNAVKYTPAGGSLGLSIDEKATDERQVACYEFVFEDNGIGMSREFMERIFEPFSRENESQSNRTQGTGLGLAIARNLVRMMGGDIRVESEQGRGSRFTVTVYLQILEDGESPGSEFAGLSVLVADDERDSCESLSLILEDLGMKAEWVLSGQEAVDKVEAAHTQGRDYFAVILDWKMPELDGIGAARAIREAAGDKVSIILRSAYDWSEVEKEARLAGVDCFISKPAFKSRLIYLFRQLVHGEAEPSNPLGELDGGEFAGKNALLTEDNEINAEIAGEILESVGLSVVNAWDGKEALDILTNSEPGHFDVVLMDIQMPVMNGYDAARAIRASGREDLRKVPIIAMTADAFAEDVQKALRAGMNQHIAKPIEIRQLMDALRKWLGGGR